MKACAYTRVSTELQGDEGFSLEHQDNQARQEIERRGWELGYICEEVVSAGKPLDKRRKLTRLLNELDKGEYDVLLITRLDRLCRSGRDFQNILHRADQNNWRLVCMDPAVDLTTAFGKAMAGMAAIFAELERELISQRTKEGMAAARARRLSIGGPMAFTDVDTLLSIERLKGSGRSNREIATILNMEGIPSAQGGNWSYSTVNKAYRRWLEKGKPDQATIDAEVARREKAKAEAKRKGARRSAVK